MHVLRLILFLMNVTNTYKKLKTLKHPLDYILPE